MEPPELDGSFDGKFIIGGFIIRKNVEIDREWRCQSTDSTDMGMSNSKNFDLSSQHVDIHKPTWAFDQQTCGVPTHCSVGIAMIFEVSMFSSLDAKAFAVRICSNCL